MASQPPTSHPHCTLAWLSQQSRVPRGKLALGSGRGEKRGAVEKQGLISAGAEPGEGSGCSRLLGELDALLLLADDLGDGAGDAAYQGPVLLEADATVFVLIQVADELVGRSAVPGVLGGESGAAHTRPVGKAGWEKPTPRPRAPRPHRQHVVELAAQHLAEILLADAPWLLAAAAAARVLVEVVHQHLDGPFQLRAFRHHCPRSPAGTRRVKDGGRGRLHAPTVEVEGV